MKRSIRLRKLRNPKKVEEEWLGLEVAIAGFESRFFSEGDGLLDYTEWAKQPGILSKKGGKLQMRRRFLELNFEGQVRGSDDFVDSRARILVKGKEILVNEVDADVGVPIILQQEKVGDHWQVWVGTFSARSIEDTIKEGR